jgi:hypothetical protein
MMTAQLPVPLHAPLQPVNVEPFAGVAVKVTEEPCVKFILQEVLQLMPDGPVTVPLPVTLIERGTELEANVAVTEVAPFRATEQVPVPLQAPPQPVNVEPLEGVAVKVIWPTLN